MWSQMTASALINGTGIVVYSLCNDCASTIIIREERYVSKFCERCNKRTFAMKFPGHVEKFPENFYELENTTDGIPPAVPEQGRSWRELIPCTVTGRGSVVTVVLAPCCRPTIETKDGELTYKFCNDCQKRCTWAKYPKPFRNKF